MAGETPCVLYEGTRNRRGYGVLPKPVYGSRLAARAALAEKLGRPVRGVTRHTCDNPPCINPDHLIEGTVGDNVRDMCERGRARGQYSAATHCKYGHPLSSENVRIKTYQDGRVERLCLACCRRRSSEQAARRKAARAAKRKETSHGK